LQAPTPALFAQPPLLSTLTVKERITVLPPQLRWVHLEQPVAETALPELAAAITNSD
jgi:hypothetical protein